MNKIFLVIVVFSLLLTGCSSFNIRKYEVEVSDFILTASISKEIIVDENFDIEVSIKYIGNEDIQISYSEELLNIGIFNQKNELVLNELNELMPYTKDIVPGELIVLNKSLVLEESGEYNILVITSPLKVDGKPIVGVNTEQIKNIYKIQSGELEDQVNTELSSTIALEYININVKD